jgi:tRNA-Thr(GGU) m(6)t(6)A37 methyltransferase TsaA
MSLTLSPIGIVHSPFKESAGTPIQTAVAAGVQGWVELFAGFTPGLQDLQGFDRIWLIYWFHRTAAARLVVEPFLDKQCRGIFATRSPCRPNPIGLSCVRLIGVEANALQVSDLDILDGTPLLDIKPYVPGFDSFAVDHIGWLEGKTINSACADERFEQRTETAKETRAC